MKRTLLLLVALFMCGVAISQEKEKKFTLSIQENLIPAGDATYGYDMYDSDGRYGCDLIFLNWLPTIELDYDNTFSARLRFNVLHADEGGGPYDPNVMYFLPPFKMNHYNHDIATSTSITLGYNLLNKSKAHRLKLSAIVGAVYTYKDYYWGHEYENQDDLHYYTQAPNIYFLPTERAWHFQIGAELAYQYFLPCTNYRLGFGASYELSYSNYNVQPTIGLLNFNVSWKLFNF